MTNRGLTTTERLQYTALTNRRTATEPTCPLCDGATRTALRGKSLYRICCEKCGWDGEEMVAETEAAAAALIAKGEGHLIGGAA